MLRQFTEAACKACERATLWGRGELAAETSQPARVEFELLEPRLLLDGYAALQRPTELQYWDPTTADNGYNFFGVTGTSYLLDMEGKVVHTWPVGTNPHLLPNGNVLDAATNDPSGYSGFKEVDWNGNTVWSYLETRSGYYPHHDFTRIFNPKLNAYTTLYIANKDLTYDQLVAAGADPARTPSTGAQMDSIVEVDSSGTVVWEWNFFDHVIQDCDPTKANYVGTEKTIADYPNKLDINLDGHNLKADWLHCNSLDYNQSLDQIVVNSVQGEFYVIDHGNTFVAGNPTASTTLAATGAGDFLYRFGDPARYGQGSPPSILDDWTLSTTGNKQLGGAHDIQWIADGLTGAGHFLIFNNAEYLSEHTSQSYVMEIDTCGSPSPVPGEPGGVQLLAPPNGTGLTLSTYSFTVVSGGKWTGGAGTAWQTPGNWSSAMTPGLTFKAVFDGPPVANQPTLGQSESVNSLLFRTAGWTISGSSLTLTVGAGGISSSGTGTNTVRPTVSFTGNASVSVGQGNTLALAAIDVGSNSLAKSGAGTLVLAGAGVCGGGTMVSEGTLLVSNTTDSGTGTGPVTVGAATLGGTGFINGPVMLTGDSTLTSTATLTINNTLTIQGLANQLAAGTVLTSGDVTIDPGAVFIINGTLGGDVGNLIVRGTLMGKGTINKSCVIEAGGVLSPGEPSTIQSMSQVRAAATPKNFSFEIGAVGPNYASPTNSVNDVLRLTDAATPFADASGAAPAVLSADTVIDVYFLLADPALGEYKAEFFAVTDFSDAVAGATYQYWRLDPRGGRYHNGNFYSPLDESLVNWSVVPETATFGGVSASGYITEFTVAPEPATLGFLATGGAVLLARRKRRK